MLTSFIYANTILDSFGIVSCIDKQEILSTREGVNESISIGTIEVDVFSNFTVIHSFIEQLDGVLSHLFQRK